MNRSYQKSLGIVSRVCTALVVLQVIVFFGSWVWSAAFPASPVRSLLSEGGIRWFFGTFITNIVNPLLGWIIILDIAFGMCVHSGLLDGACRRFFSKKNKLDAQQRSGLKTTAGLLAVEIAVVLLLILPAHAVLLSVTGNLFPSSFSVSIIPILAFMGVTLSVCYGLFSGTLHNYKDVVRCACHGGAELKTILIIYVLAMELYCSFVYVLG